MKTIVILNPAAGGGAAEREREHILSGIRDALGTVELAQTERRTHATELTRAAWSEGFRRFIAVGGDGTLNEVVNGLPVEDAPGEAILGMVAAGTGGDFRRTVGIDAGVTGAIERLRSGGERRIDVGRVSFLTDEGELGERLFVNIASFGLSGVTDRRVNRLQASRRLGGRALFQASAIAAFLTYRFPAVRLVIDGRPLEAEILTVAVANGRYFGGGMMYAPEADPGDGLFDVIVARRRAKIATLIDMNKVYRGEHVRHTSVRTFRAREVVAEPRTTAPVLLDVDGEDPGRLPARFELLPAALRLLC